MNQRTTDQSVTDPHAERVDTLSIIVCADAVPDAPRVWVVHRHGEETTAFATSPAHPYQIAAEAGVPPGGTEVAVRTRELDSEALQRFERAMQRVSEVLDSGLTVWTPLRTSAAFAAGIWESTFDERLDHRTLGLSTPATLARSIRSANANDLGLEEEHHHEAELPLSKRDPDLGQHDAQADARNRSQGRGHGRSL